MAQELRLCLCHVLARLRMNRSPCLLYHYSAVLPLYLEQPSVSDTPPEETLQLAEDSSCSLEKLGLSLSQCSPLPQQLAVQPLECSLLPSPLCTLTAPAGLPVLLLLCFFSASWASWTASSPPRTPCKCMKACVCLSHSAAGCRRCTNTLLGVSGAWSWLQPRFLLVRL